MAADVNGANDKEDDHGDQAQTPAGHNGQTCDLLTDDGGEGVGQCQREADLRADQRGGHGGHGVIAHSQHQRQNDGHIDHRQLAHTHKAVAQSEGEQQDGNDDNAAVLDLAGQHTDRAGDDAGLLQNVEAACHGEGQRDDIAGLHEAVHTGGKVIHDAHGVLLHLGEGGGIHQIAAGFGVVVALIRAGGDKVGEDTHEQDQRQQNDKGMGNFQFLCSHTIFLPLHYRKIDIPMIPYKGRLWQENLLWGKGKICGCADLQKGRRDGIMRKNAPYRRQETGRIPDL